MKPQDPKISVVMPVRNGGRYLDAAVKSIRSQTFDGFEFLIVDDGSTDETPAILERHRRGDPRIRILESDGAGIVAALNLGIAEARGDLIARMDADDVAMPARFELQVRYMEAHPALVACGTCVDWIDASGSKTGEKSAILTGPIALADLHTGNRFFHPTMMIRREALIAAGLYRTGCTFAEDYDLWLRLAERGTLANVPEKLLKFRKHGAQTSTAKRLAQRAATALARQAALRRINGFEEGADLSNSLEQAVREYLSMRGAEPAPLRAFEARDLLVLARFAQQQAGRRWISAIESRIKRETGLRKAWLLPVWYYLDRSKA